MPRSDVRRRPTLLSGCAMAATAAEARFRIAYPFRPRDSRIIAVDGRARTVVCGASQRGFSGTARFLVFEAPVPGDGNGSAPDAALRTCGGTGSRLGTELAGADVVVMVAGAAGAEGAEAASVIGRACAERGVMTAGVVLTKEGERVNPAVLALRPYAMVLVVSNDEDDLIELLTALRV